MKLTPDTAKRVTDLLSGLSVSAPGRAASVPGVEKPTRSRTGMAERRPGQEQSAFERALRERKDGLSAAQDRREPAVIEPAGPSVDARDAADPQRDDEVNAAGQTASGATDRADPNGSNPAEDASVEDSDPAETAQPVKQVEIAIDPELRAILKASVPATAAVVDAIVVGSSMLGAPTTATGPGLPATAAALNPNATPAAQVQAAAPVGVPGQQVSGEAGQAAGPVAPGQTATEPSAPVNAAPGQPAAAGEAAGSPAQAVTPPTPPTAEAVARQRAAEPVRNVDQPLTIDSLNRLLLMQPDATLAPAHPTVFGADPLGLVRSASRNAVGSAANAAPVNAPAAPPAASRQASAPAQAPASAPSQRGPSKSSDAGALASAPTAPSAPGAPASAQPGAPAGQPPAPASMASNPAASANAARADAQPSPATPSFAAQVQRAINAVESQLRSRSSRPQSPAGRAASPASQVTPPNPASSGSVVVRLHPEGLGQMRVHLSMQGDAAKLRFQVGGEQARELLASSLDSLRSALEAKGLSVDRAQVELSPSLSPVLAQPQPGQPASQPTTPSPTQPDADLRQPQADVGGQGERHGGSGNERPGSGGTAPRANAPAGDNAGLAPELLSPAPVVIDTARGRVRLTA